MRGSPSCSFTFHLILSPDSSENKAVPLVFFFFIYLFFLYGDLLSIVIIIVFTLKTRNDLVVCLQVILTIFGHFHGLFPLQEDGIAKIILFLVSLLKRR